MFHKRTKLILVIDDSADNRTLLETLFQSHDWNIYTASDGREALSLLRELAVLPDLILLDLEMPNMSGTEFLGEQSRTERIKSIPVVVMSATDAVETRALGTEGVLTKPLQINTLIEKVSAFL